MAQGMKILEPRYMKARALVAALKRAYWPRWSKDRNIVGMAFGQRIVRDEFTDEPALIVYVVRKTNEDFVPSSRLLPRRLYIGRDSVEVDVVETGVFYPFEFTARERPATHGISIGNVNEGSAGTFGAVVLDNTDNAPCILSNNHVMARQNAASAGEVIVQPGVFDGGSGADAIATLRRFVMLNATGNAVDGAIAAITNFGTDVIEQVHDNLIPIASADHPAVGLLFAGSCNSMIMNPIAQVLAQLNIRFPNANATATADIGMNVEKVGRTTEYTTGTVREIDATVTIGYDFGDAEFDNQITTRWMSDRGDSGSVVYRGGKGSNRNKCICPITLSAEEVLGTSLATEKTMAQTVRDKFLRQTLLGSWAVDVFELNERELTARANKTKFEKDDVAFARKMFAKYRGEAIEAFARGTDSDQRLTEKHLKDAQEGLKRAQKYLSEDERVAADRLFKLGADLGRNKTPRELLALLNDKKVYAQVREILSGVRSLRFER